MNPWILAGVGMAALAGGCLLLRECWGLISVRIEMTDEEREASREADERQAQFQKTGTYFPPHN